MSTRENIRLIARAPLQAADEMAMYVQILEY